MNIKLHQMAIKSAFLNGVLNEEAYVQHLKGFVDSSKPDHVYKLEKALYGLKQAPRSWYQRLTDFLLEINFLRGEAHRTLFVKRTKGHVIIMHIYVDDIVFGSSCDSLLKSFDDAMSATFEMSMVGDLNYFLGLQIKQTNEGIFVSQKKNALNLTKRFDLD